MYYFGTSAYCVVLQLVLLMFSWLSNWRGGGEGRGGPFFFESLLRFSWSIIRFQKDMELFYMMAWSKPQPLLKPLMSTYKIIPCPLGIQLRLSRFVHPSSMLEVQHPTMSVWLTITPPMNLYRHCLSLPVLSTTVPTLCRHTGLTCPQAGHV